MRASLPLPRATPRGFTLLELLVAMAMFAILGIALVTLLGQGMTIFHDGMGDTSMQDRLAAVVPMIRADLASIQPVEPSGVPPPVASIAAGGGAPPGPAAAPAADPEPPASRLRAGWLKLSDVPAEVPPVYFVALVRTNGRESEDPQLREAGTSARATGVAQVDYTPGAVDSSVVGNLRATGGLLEVVWVAVPDDPERPGILTLYRLFRAPPGGTKSLLEPSNLNSLSKIHAAAAGHSIQEGVLDFRVTFRNVFATSWTDGLARPGARLQDGDPYVGPVWDSTRGLDEKFALFRAKNSAADIRDDVFPVMARFELTLATPGTFGFTRGDTSLSAAVSSADERKIRLEDVSMLLRPGPVERWLKVDSEWMSTTYDTVDPGERRLTALRGQRGTPAKEHLSSAPVYIGASAASDVTLVGKDRYARHR